MLFLHNKDNSYNNIHQLNEAQEIEIKNMSIFLDETAKIMKKKKKRKMIIKRMKKWIKVKRKIVKKVIVMMEKITIILWENN